MGGWENRWTDSSIGGINGSCCRSVLSQMNETYSDATGRSQSVVDGGSAPDVGARRRHGRCGGAPEPAAEQLDEDALERAVEHGVDDRVDGRRHVAEPQAEGHKSVGDVVRAR